MAGRQLVETANLLCQAELKQGDLPRAPNRAVCGGYLALLREVMEHLELKRQWDVRSKNRGTGVGMKRVKREEDVAPMPPPPAPAPAVSAGAGQGPGAMQPADMSDGDVPRSEKRQRVARRPFDE